MQFIGKTKAGIQFTDKAKQIIQEAVKDTEYEKRKQEQRKSYQRTVEEYQSILKDVPETSIEQSKKYVDERIDQVEEIFYNQEDKYYLYLDIDMFYAAVEIVEKPFLKEKPVIVGSSIVSAANYIARKFGIRSAMPVFVADQLCQDLVKIPCDISKYKSYSERVYKVLRIFDPNCLYIGLDEACLNIQDYLIKNEEQIKKGLALEKKQDTLSNKMYYIMQEISKQIYKQTQLTVSQGVAPNRYLAKLASEHLKPNGQFFIPLDKKFIYEFIDKKDVRQLKGVGPATEYILKGLQIKNGKELRDNLHNIYLTFSTRSFNSLLEKAIGYQSHELKEVKNPSFYKSKTFKDSQDFDFLKEVLKKCSEEVQQKLKEENLAYKRFTLTLTFGDFNKISLSDSLIDHTTNISSAVTRCEELLKTKLSQSIRLVGIKVSDFKVLKELVPDIKEYIRQNSSKKKLKKIDSYNFENTQGILTCVVQCPICNKQVDTKGINRVLNNHIDKCLRGTVNQIYQKNWRLQQ